MMVSKLDQREAPKSWTCVTDDDNHIRHLVALYLCWEYPNFAPISKEPLPTFTTSKIDTAPLGSQISDRSSDGKVDSPECSDDAFFEEACQLLASADDHHVITTIQALGIMSLREARRGRIAESRYYATQGMHLAIEMCVHCDSAVAYIDPDVISKTFWGIFTLNQYVLYHIAALARAES